MSEIKPGQHELCELGRTIRQIRTERSLSVQQLALATDVEEATIEALEAGHLDPPYDLLLAVAGGLSVSSATLITRAEQRRHREHGNSSTVAPS